MSDREIQRRIEELLERSSRVDQKEVTVEVNGAVVTLTGAVDSAIEKRTARHLAEDTQGVKAVRDRLTVKTFVRRSNEELEHEVRNRLRRDPFVGEAAGRVEVYANQGEVRLDGYVPTYAVRKAVEDVTWWTPGVINVENLLLVTDEEFVDVSPGQAVGS